jgi:GNAT superfamily N-acetyltransferase
MISGHEGPTIDALVPILLDESWIPAAELLSREAGWNQVTADWSVFFSHGKVFGFIVEDRLIATAAALPQGETLGWVSMVLVTAAWRRKGLASRLVAACISFLRNSGRAAMLDAAPGGVNIYASLGFVPLCSMERWEANGVGAGEPGTTTKALPDAIAAWDRNVFGADRRYLLQDFLLRPESSLWQTDHASAILRRGFSAAQIGPIWGKPDHACALVAEIVRAENGRIVVDVLESGKRMLPGLQDLGFQKRRCFTRMALDLSALPGKPGELLAAAGPEFG